MIEYELLIEYLGQIIENKIYILDLNLHLPQLKLTMLRVKNVGLILLFTLLSIGLPAQYGESIRSGRPGQAIGPFTVGQGIFQVQSGIDYNSLNSGSQNTYLSNNVFRFGLTEQFEMGLGLNLQQDRFASRYKDTESGISSISLRIRSNVYGGKGIIPSFGYQFNLGLPMSSENYKSENVIPKLTLMSGHKLSDKFGLTNNFGFSWTEKDPNPTKFYIINLGYSLTNKIGLFIENYGFLQRGQFDSKFDGGLDYLITNNLKLDLSAGYDKNDFTNEMFISFGVSWRTARKEKE